MKILRSVLLFVTAAAVVGCSAPATEQASGSARSTPTAPKVPAPPPAAVALAPSAPAPGDAVGWRRPRDGGPCQPLVASPEPCSAPGPSADVPAAPAPHSSSAYLGCGEPIPTDKLWDETTEGEVLEAIGAAKACAAANGRRLLLEFVAPWCDDCREMARLDETSVVAQTLKARFERVRVNVGKWDRHEGLRRSYDVRALATYIVIDPKTSKQLAKTTLEPITKKGKKLSADEWARWLGRY